MNAPADFVLALHSHLPWVLHHGRWPHGSDWLCEAALDTYLPLLEELRALAADDVPAPITLGVTPVLANQLAHPAFATEFAYFLEERLAACRRAPAELEARGESSLTPLVAFWRARLERLRALFDAVHGDLAGALRELQDEGRLELISSAATHGYLPLLARDESVRLQLLTGFRESRRVFGRDPRGCWLPECAYRPGGVWSPDGWTGSPANRVGTDRHLADAGFRYVFVDAHAAAAGTPLGGYGDVPLGAERFDLERHGRDTEFGRPERTPYVAYEIGHGVRALVRDPRSSMQVWSRHQGYPGDEWYLEFHKIRWPGGLKLWRVTGPGTDLGAKHQYDPIRADQRVASHAEDFADLLGAIAGQDARTSVVVAPFDTELFGHWWFEGIAFLGRLYRRLARHGGVRAVTASEHLGSADPAPAIRVAEGSWGAGGDHAMWLNDETRWTWERLWAIEDRFWRLAPGALGDEGLRPVLAQAGRELLIAQASDWQFIISTGATADYGVTRFTRHCDAVDLLLAGLEPNASEADRHRAHTLAAEWWRRDGLFPDVLDTIASAGGGARSA